VPAASQTIHLSTPSATYDIHIGRGLLASLYPRLVKLAAGKPFRPFFVTSHNIWDLWLHKVLASFPQDRPPTVLFLPPGEKYKRLPAVESLAEQLAQAGADRDSILIAFGGGVLGDIAGFLAAIYMRGVPYVQIPSTLLAQVDSSVGGKTGVNLAAGKNLVGSFHHPRAVYADVDLLSTLPPRELRAGLQESIKAAIIASPTLFRTLEHFVPQLREATNNPVPHLPEATNNPVPHLREAKVGPATYSALQRIIASSIQVKADVVALDEKEAQGGPRMTLNFGHTLGHAIEAATGYKKLLHGEAVAWGSIAALHLSLARGTITAEQFARMANLILACGPLPRFKATPEELVALTASDKKTRSGKRAFILATGIGSTQIVFDVTDRELATAAAAMLADMRTSTST
jgi:3-dehydroquinate synthase